MDLLMENRHWLLCLGLLAVIAVLFIRQEVSRRRFLSSLRRAYVHSHEK